MAPSREDKNNGKKEVNQKMKIKLKLEEEKVLVEVHLQFVKKRVRKVENQFQVYLEVVNLGNIQDLPQKAIQVLNLWNKRIRKKGNNKKRKKNNTNKKKERK